MPRNQVFISYSHNDKDQAFLKEFRVHLKPWEDTGQLNVWSDQRITPSQAWDQEIKDALASTAVAVLLVSPDFLASKYIREVELPALLHAREEGRLDLCCLYLRPSTVADDDMVFEAPLSSGKKVSINLTKYQGLNSPGTTLSLQENHRHDAIYAEVTIKIIRLFTKRLRTEARFSRGNHYDLTVQLKLHGTQLTRKYLHPYSPIPDYRSAYDTGQSLFVTLFGSQEQCDKVLQVLFDLDLAPPIRHPVRIRLQIEDSHLAELPWTETRWQGLLLRNHGWTFELINPEFLNGSLDQTPDFSDITLKTPCSVLLIAPSSAPDTESHQRDLEEHLKHAWPVFHDSVQRVQDWNTLQQVWAKSRPRIVYYYGPAESNGKMLFLPLDNGLAVDQRPVTDLAQLWQANPPRFVFCNFVGSPGKARMPLPGLHSPLVISQYSTDPREARRAFLAWLYELLHSGEDTDPVWALHQYGLPSSIAWGAYKNWRTETTDKQKKHQFPRLLLDRTTPRARGLQAINELVRNQQRRLCCMLAYGTQETLVDHFFEQLYDHLRREAKEVAHAYRVPMRCLPGQHTFNEEQLALKVRQHLGLGDRETFIDALAKKVQRAPGPARPVLLLDWGTRGTSEATRLHPTSLEAWLTFCLQQLCTPCPRDLRILSFLALELPTERHKALEDKMEELSALARFRERSFRLDVLPPLGRIKASDLADFLDGRYSTCPDDLLATMPELIVQKTGGLFKETVELLELAEHTGWHDLHQELVVESHDIAYSFLCKNPRNSTNS
ncbi:MAG: toll/interleukin-1 receptor domain-containing protein [Deltaproteobacteria bacterium]|nr:toll/interleukin-1 receptor domain-containing protein [Deltaproteobacteria bacterium]